MKEEIDGGIPVDYISHYISKFRKLSRSLQIKEVLSLSFFILALVWLILMVLEKFLPFSFILPSLARNFIILVFVFSFFRILQISRKWSKATQDEIALKIEERIPSINNLLINSVQISRKLKIY